MAGIYIYGQILDKAAMCNNDRTYRRHITSLIEWSYRILKEDITTFLIRSMELFNFYKSPENSYTSNPPIKLLGSLLLLQTPKEWDNIWATIHNPLFTEETNSFMWEQIYPKSVHYTFL